MDMGQIAAAVSSLKVAGEIAQGLVSLKTMAEVHAKAVELNEKLIATQHQIFAANAAQSALVERVRELESEITRVKAWEAQKQRYKLHSPWGGTSVYALKGSMSAGEPGHWICTRCYEDGRRSILQFVWDAQIGGIYVCPSCTAKFYYPHTYSPDHPIPYASE